MSSVFPSNNDHFAYIKIPAKYLGAPESCHEEIQTDHPVILKKFHIFQFYIRIRTLGPSFWDYPRHKIIRIRGRVEICPFGTSTRITFYSRSSITNAEARARVRNNEVLMEYTTKCSQDKSRRKCT